MKTLYNVKKYAKLNLDFDGIERVFSLRYNNVVNLHIFRSQISTEAFLHMRYSGTDCALMCTAVPHKEAKVNRYFHCQ